MKQAILFRLRISEQTGTLIYLGVLMTGGRFQRMEYIPLVQRVHDCLERWQASTLSMMGKLTLIKSILSSILVYLLANTVLPTWCLHSSFFGTSYGTPVMITTGFTWFPGTLSISRLEMVVSRSSRFWLGRRCCLLDMQEGIFFSLIVYGAG